MGCEDVWYCKGCGAEGGFSNYSPTNDKPGKPRHLTLQLPSDCEISLIMINAYDIGLAEGKEIQRRDSTYKNVTRPFLKRLEYLFTRHLIWIHRQSTVYSV